MVYITAVDVEDKAYVMTKEAVLWILLNSFIA